MREFSPFFVAVGSLLGILNVNVPLLSFGTLEFALKRNAFERLATVISRPDTVKAKRPQQRGMLRVLSFLNRLALPDSSMELTLLRRGLE